MVGEVPDVFNQLWIEKFRPNDIEQVVLNEPQKVFFKKCLDKDEIPHVLFCGPPGSGKTTLARILTDNLVKNSMDLLCMNGSDTTGVEYVRDTVVSFLKSPPFASRFKYVFIDEFDYMTKNAQAILRNVMETYSGNGRFILTCNYESKIIEPLLSRLTKFEMKSMPKEYVISFVKNILNTENVIFDDKTVELTVTSLIPDIRKIVNTIQKNVEDGKLKTIKQEDLVTSENKITGLIINLCDSIGTDQQNATTNKVLPTIMSILNSSNEPEYVKIYESLFDHEGLPAWAKIKVNQYANSHNGAFSDAHHFMAMCYEILQAGLYFYKTFGVKR